MEKEMKLEEVTNSRLEKYAEKLRNKPSRRNQLVIKDGEGMLIVNGKKMLCHQIEGYVKLPSMDSLMSCNSLTRFGISILPKNRLILSENENNFFRGYRNNNDDCFLIIHAVSENNDLLIVDFGMENVPAVILLEDRDEENINERLFQFYDFCIKKEKLTISDNKTCEIKEEDEEDAWE